MVSLSEPLLWDGGEPHPLTHLQELWGDHRKAESTELTAQLIAEFGGPGGREIRDC